MKDNHYIRIGTVDIDTGSYWYTKIAEALKDKEFVIAENPFSPSFDIVVKYDEYYAGGKKNDIE